LSGIKKLAGQTLWYGIPTIASRFLGYALNIFLFWIYQPTDTANITQVYAVIPFLNILFTYGIETSYFRFAQTTDKKQLYNTLMTCMVFTTLVFAGLIYFNAATIANWIDFADHPEYVQWIAWILLFDTLAVLPFSTLRQEGKPKRFAFIKVVSIVFNVGITIFFVGICPKLYAENPSHWLLAFYNPSIGIGYYIIANIAGSVLALLLLWKQLTHFRFQFNGKLWQEVMRYSYPLIIVGMGGMINEMLSRLVYTRVLDLPAAEEKFQLGVFGANYKVAVLITIFIQVFKMGAEPFFFNQSADKNAPSTYARVMKFFVIACCLMWLAIAVNLPLIKYVVYGNNQSYSEGLHIIPILAMGSVFLGIYYNLTVWYKLNNKTMIGAWITIAGAAITILLNIWWIPLFGYTGSAWATLVCYAFMMVVSYKLGQQHYRIPYATKKLIAYIVIVVLLFFAYSGLAMLWDKLWFTTTIGLMMVLLFVLFIVKVERKEFQKIPILSKYIK
jgi:O-antigen/teichoic acid export membrane protein